MKLSIKLTSMAVIIAGVLFFAGCEKQSPTAPDNLNYRYDSPSEIAGAVSSDENNNPNPENGYRWPTIASHTYTYNYSLKGYDGGKIQFGENNRSKFELEDLALALPAGPSMSPKMKDVTITMQIDYDTTAKELLFEFGPHGCQFDPRAHLMMDYKVLGVEVPVLFYIDENGNRIEMQPNQINTNKKWLIIRLDHFSRYAVAVSR